MTKIYDFVIYAHVNSDPEFIYSGPEALCNLCLLALTINPLLLFQYFYAKTFINRRIHYQNMDTKDSLGEIKKIIVPVLKRNDVVKAGIFGSFARGEAKKKSDIDILIKFKGRKSLFDLAGLEIELEGKTGKKVDLLTYNSIHPLLKERILKEEVHIL